MLEKEERMEEKALEFLLRYSDWIKDAGFFSSIWHTFIMWLIRFSYHVAYHTERVMDQVFKVTGFLDHGIIRNVYTSMKVLSLSVLAVAIIYVAYKYLFSDQVDLKGSLLRGLIFLNLIIYLPGLMNSAMDVTKATFDATKDLQGTGSSLSYNIVQSNMADLIYLSRNGFERLDSNDPKDLKMNLTEEAFKIADLTEMILPSDISDLKKTASNEENTEALSYQTKVDEDGSLYADKIKNGWFSTFDNGKFRFKADVSTILISLWTMAFVYLCSAFTIGTSILDLVFARILFPVLSASDVESGGKVKNMVLDMGNTYVTIMLTGFTVSLFSVYFTFLSTLDLNIVSYAILCCVGVSMSLAGPRTFGKYLGIDTSARSGVKAIIGGYYGAKSLMGIGKAAANLAEGALKTPEEARKAHGKVVNGINNKVDDGKKLIDGAKDGLDQKVNDIFDNPPTTLDSGNPLDSDQYDSEGDSTDNDNEKSNGINANQNDSDQEDGANTAPESDKEIEKEQTSSLSTQEDKSVDESDTDQEGQDMTEEQQSNAADVDSDGKVTIQDTQLDQNEKTVNDQTDDKENDLSTVGSPADDTTVNEENVSTQGIENPERKSMDNLVEDDHERKITDPQYEPLNENVDGRNKVDNPEQVTVSDDVSQKDTHVQADKNIVPESPSNQPSAPESVDDISQPNEAIRTSENAIYEESKAKPIWNDKKENESGFKKANDKLKKLNAEDYLPPSNIDGGNSNDE